MQLVGRGGRYLGEQLLLCGEELGHHGAHLPPLLQLVLQPRVVVSQEARGCLNLIIVSIGQLLPQPKYRHSQSGGQRLPQPYFRNYRTVIPQPKHKHSQSAGQRIPQPTVIIVSRRKLLPQPIYRHS